MKTKNKQNAGFTLVEIMLVISIICLLASVIVLTLSSARIKSRDGKRVADIHQMASAFELYYTDNFSYPTSTVGNSMSLLSKISLPYLSPDYVDQIPNAPVPADGTCDIPYGAGGLTANDYQFMSKSTTLSTVYTLTFCIGNSTGLFSPGVHTLTQAGIQ